MAKVQINFVCFRDFMIDILAISRLKSSKVRGQKYKNTPIVVYNWAKPKV